MRSLVRNIARNQHDEHLPEANREVIDKIGVPPDHHVPLTPEDAAAGRDPALAKALALLHK